MSIKARADAQARLAANGKLANVHEAAEANFNNVSFAILLEKAEGLVEEALAVEIAATGTFSQILLLKAI